MTKFPLIFTREFPLLLVEVWGRAYLSMFGRSTQARPRNVFIIRDGLTENYRNPNLYDELNHIFLRQSKTDATFTGRFCQQARQQYHRLFGRTAKPLRSLNDLYKFCRSLQEFWPAVYASFHIPSRLANSLSSADINSIIRLRADIADAADKAGEVIRRSVAVVMPAARQFADYVETRDLKRTKVGIVSLQKRAKAELILVDGARVSEKRFRDIKQRFHFYLSQPRDKGARILKGQVAYQGLAHGIVRQVIRRADVVDFPRGAILVSTMTVPDFLPAMKRAAAFVTDEGGVTCHAAIVAREFKVPCVIGTKFATRLLKNGTQVKVDAHHGIVRVEKAAKL